LTLCFEKLTEAIALNNHWGDVKQAMPRDAEICAHNAMQAVLWQTLGEAVQRTSLAEKMTFTGCYDLASMEESFVLYMTRTGKDDQNRLNALINCSYRVCLSLRTAE
jgi:hypothetical protein